MHGTITILPYFPGQKVSIFLEVVDGYGRVDSLTTPKIDGILNPDFTTMAGYPQFMGKVGTGLYVHQFVLPTGASAVGSYLAEASYTYVDGYVNSQLFQIVVNAPFGNFGTVSF
jgi:hypothetical protein